MIAIVTVSVQYTSRSILIMADNQQQLVSVSTMLRYSACAACELLS